MADHTSAVIPMLTYEDGTAAMDWLAKAFGFHEVTRMLSSDGRLDHGEMTIGGGRIMLASGNSDYESPKRHREHCERARRWQQTPFVVDGVLVFVDNVEEHHVRAKQAGATILSPPETGWPGPRYRAEDLEGHRWMFMQRSGKQ